MTYRHPKTYPIPDLDLLTFCFDSPHSTALEDSILHSSAEKPSIGLNKAGLRRLAEEFAYGLRKRYNVGAHGRNKDVVVVFSTGQPAYPAAFFSIVAAGGVASLASPSYTAYELARQIRQGQSTLLITSADMLEVARDAVAQVQQGAEGYEVALLVLSSDPDWSLRVDGLGDEGELRGVTLEERLSWERITDPRELRESLIALLYSSGTTGEPKGVMLSHDNFVSQSVILSGPAREAAAVQIAEGVKLPPRRSLAHLPAAHIAGVFGYLISPPVSGGTVFWMKKYNWKEFLKYNRSCKITAVYTVPSIFLRIAKDPSVTDHFKTMYYAAGGAAPLDGALMKAANKKIGDGNVQMGQAYGLSETTGAVTAPAAGEKDDTGSIGPVLPNTEVRIVDTQDKDVPKGTPGELIVRGRIVTNGYYRNEKATKGAFRNGWFATGDIAIDRNDKLYIIDRIKELIKYKGLQIAPAEIEGLLDEHPDILEAAVVGVPDPSENAENSGAAYSEIPRAYVVKVPGSTLSKREVQDFVLAKLAPYKALRGGVSFVEELPKNGLNKLLRRDLREIAIKEVKSEMGAKL